MPKKRVGKNAVKQTSNLNSAPKEGLFKEGKIIYRYLTELVLGTYATNTLNVNLEYRQEHIFILNYGLLKKANFELGYELNSCP